MDLAESGPAGERSLIGFVVSALSSLSRRYLQMESASSGEWLATCLCRQSLGTRLPCRLITVMQITLSYNIEKTCLMQITLSYNIEKTCLMQITLSYNIEKTCLMQIALSYNIEKTCLMQITLSYNIEKTCLMQITLSYNIEKTCLMQITLSYHIEKTCLMRSQFLMDFFGRACVVQF